METPQIVLEALTNNEAFTRKVLPFLKPEYFPEAHEKEIFKHCKDYFEKFNGCITPEALGIELNNGNAPEGIHKAAIEQVSYFKDESQNTEWLTATAEKFCKDRSIYLAIMNSISIIDGTDKKKDPGCIPSLLQEALSVTFDTRIGHDYLEDVDSRYEFYHQDEQKIPFGIKQLDDVTGGGLRKKSLTCIMGGTGSGKSQMMSSLSSYWIQQGLNVLYVTLEMAEERIAERIDANLMNIPITAVHALSKVKFKSAAEKVKEMSRGRIVVRELPTSSCHTGHIRSLCQELRIKKNFVPDIICVDYVNLLLSQRFKGGQHNSYTLVKAAAEELRGLAMELGIPIVTATQLTRGGNGASDVDMSDTSESFGLPMTLDLFFALIATEELEQMNQVIIKVLKNRWGEQSRKFMLGVDRPRMKFYDLDDDAAEEEYIAPTTTRTTNTMNKDKFKQLR